MTYRLTLLEQLRIVRDDGKELGRLMDMRVRVQLGPLKQADSVAVDALLVGARGWLERLGFRVRSEDEVKPEAVRTIERDRLIVTSSPKTRAAKATQKKARNKRRT
jgi:hypothetical protein